MLNFIGRLSGIATLTRAFADKIAHTNARIVCTRKTTPGLRALEKRAVRCGGGTSHRYGLDDAILIKDNHIAACGSIAEALVRAKAYAGHLRMIEVEVDMSRPAPRGAEIFAACDPARQYGCRHDPPGGRDRQRRVCLWKPPETSI